MAKDTGPRMEMRALLAVLLSMLVLTLYQYFFVPPAPSPEQLAAEQEARELEPDQPTPADAILDEELPPETAEPVVTGQTVGADAPRELTVDGGRWIARITNVGGRIVSFRLLDYLDSSGDPIDLVHPSARAADDLMLELVAPGAPAAARAANSAWYEVSVDGFPPSSDSITIGSQPVEVALAWEDGAGRAVRKRLVFPPLGYQLGMSVEARLGGEPAWLQIGPGLNPVAAAGRMAFLSEGAVLLGDGGLEHWTPEDIDGSVSLSGAYRWAALESHYFLGAVLLEGSADVRLVRTTLPAPGPVAPEDAEDAAAPAEVDLATLQVRVPEAGLDAPLLLAPKRYQLLSDEGHDLQRVVDFGWFGIIARPLLFMLVWIHSFVGNYGVAIILLTVLLRVAFLPLNHKAMVSMRRTQQIQPQMTAIRNKYKGVKELEKRQKMNEEIMELYRREGVSPLGGCLPMLAQLPILFAFYRLLSVAIELRGAPFVLWIQDLAQHDPYYVLPLLMGGTMLLQQRMTPTSGVNPAQARMMKLMPIIFTALFLSVPSGLVLYWTTNNVLGIGQQVYVNRTLDPPTPSKGKSKKGPRGKRGKS